MHDSSFDGLDYAVRFIGCYVGLVLILNGLPISVLDVITIISKTAVALIWVTSSIGVAEDCYVLDFMVTNDLW